MNTLTQPTHLRPGSLAGPPRIDDLRADVVDWLRRLQAGEIEELHLGTANERQLLGALVQIYNGRREILADDVPAPRRRLARPIDAVEVELLLERHRIEDEDLEDEARTGGAAFPRRTLQLCVRRKQAVRPDTLVHLCKVLNAVLQARGSAVVVTQADLLPVSVPLEQLRQHLAMSPCKDMAVFLAAVNERIRTELAGVGRRGTLTVRRPELAADQLAGADIVPLMHFQLRAVCAALGVSATTLLAPPSPAPQADGGRARQWLQAHGLNALAERIEAAWQWRDGGFRIDPYSGPADNPTQPYATAQCLVALLHAGRAAQRGREMRQALKLLAASRREYRTENQVIHGWRYFVTGGTELDYPIADIACWVVLAEASALRLDLWTDAEKAQAQQRLIEDVEALLRQQAPSGGVVPIPHVEDRHARTYTTAMTVWAVTEALRVSLGDDAHQARWVDALNRAVGWLLDHHRADIGFIPDPGVARAAFLPGLHAQCTFTLHLLERLRRAGDIADGVQPIAEAAPLVQAARLLTDWLGATRPRFDENNITIDRHAHFPPTRYRCENSRHLWAPWAIAALHHMAALGTTSAAALGDQVAVAFQEYWQQRGERDYGCNGTYELAEALYGFSHLAGQ